MVNEEGISPSDRDRGVLFNLVDPGEGWNWLSHLDLLGDLPAESQISSLATSDHLLL